MSFILIIINNPLKVKIALFRYAYSLILIPDISYIRYCLDAQYTKWEEKKRRI